MISVVILLGDPSSHPTSLKESVGVDVIPIKAGDEQLFVRVSTTADLYPGDDTLREREPIAADRETRGADH